MKKFVPVYEGSCASTAFRFPAASASAAAFAFSGGASSRWCFPRMWPLSRTSTPTPSSPCIPLRPSRLSPRPFCRCRRCRCLPGGGGGLTNGQRSASIATYAEHQGAFGLVCNAFITEGGHSGHQGDGGDPAGVHGGVGAGGRGREAGGEGWISSMCPGRPGRRRSWPISGRYSRRCLSLPPAGDG